MNRNDLQRLASDWVRIAKNDLRNKVLGFMNETNATHRELAYELAISDGELQQIVEGNGEITLSTLAKILIASGFAFEIKPISETPLNNYENLQNETRSNRCNFSRPTNLFDENDEVEAVEARPNVFERQPQPRRHSLRDEHGRFVPRTRENDNERVEAVEARPNVFERQPQLRKHPLRDEHGRFVSRTRENDSERVEAVEASPFESMPTSKLIKIIKERLWDSEIDTNSSTKKQLVDFLNEKDKRMKERKRMTELENDPKVCEFKKRLQKTIQNNPHLTDWMNDVFGNL